MKQTDSFEPDSSYIDKILLQSRARHAVVKLSLQQRLQRPLPSQDRCGRDFPRMSHFGLHESLLYIPEIPARLTSS